MIRIIRIKITLLFSLVITGSLLIFFIFPAKTYAVFSMNIKDSSPVSVSSNEQEVTVNVLINSLPSLSYFRVEWQGSSGGSYFGYVKDSLDNWVKIAGNQDCSNYFRVSDIGITSLVLITKIGDDFNPINGNYVLKVRRYTSTCGSYSDSEPYPIEIILPTLDPSPSANPTSPPSENAIKATYKINTPKDGNSVMLSSVQIYVDGSYTHHEDDEILQFFNGHECYTGVDCSLGTHTISLRKSGYASWEDTQNFSAGENLEVNPVLNKLDPPASTIAPTVVSTPTKTPKPTPTNTPLPSEKPATESAVLGIEIDSEITPNPTPEVEIAGKKKVLILPLVLVSGGLCFIAVSIFSMIRNVKKDSEGS